MIIQHRDTKKIKAKDWFIFELRSEDTAEATLRRVCEEIPGIFNESAVEVFVPVGKRDLMVFELMSGPYFYVRTDDTNCACRLRGITGVAGFVTSDGGMSPKRALYVDQDFIEDMKQKSLDMRENRCADLKWGSFVRIMDSQYRDLCGHVDSIEGDYAIVKVELLTKQVWIETPIRNLLNLSTVPPERRVF